MSFPISTKRHSLSHVMAQAVKSIYGQSVQAAIGPDIDTGFYYDFDFGDIVIGEEQLKEIEKKMKNIIKQNQSFVRVDVAIDEAIAFLKSLGETYKVEMAEDLKAKWETKLGFYVNASKQKGDAFYEALKLSGVDFTMSTFIDMCQGPHVENTKELDENAFKLDKIAGAYWRGDASKKMLTRIYAFAFDTREELDAHSKMLEEAKKRDHRIIGKKMKLFTISELVGSGLPLIQPKGMIMRKAIEE